MSMRHLFVKTSPASAGCKFIFELLPTLFTMRLVLVFLCILGYNVCLWSQVADNINLGMNWRDDDLPTSSGVRYNDIWGYVDCDGNEYAILGSARYTHFINVSNPQNVVETNRFEETINSIWRDYKTYQTYAYGVADQGNEGLAIFDLSNLPNSVSRITLDNSVFNQAHNIYIDEENHRLYVAGANSGLIVYDLENNPAEPELLAIADLSSGGGYVHDVFVRNNIAYCSHGWNGYYVWDFTNPSNPQILASVPTNGYNHSSWLTDDNQYAIVAEEVPSGLPLLVIDLSNLNNGEIEVVKDFKEPLLTPTDDNNTPHNPFIRGNHLVVSYYEDGVQVFDISNPLNPTRIAHYDTRPLNTQYNGTTGNWGVYPFLPSGTILASDTQTGLFVLNPDYGTIPPIAFDQNPSVNWVDDSDISSCDAKTANLEVSGSAQTIQWLVYGQIDSDFSGNSIEVSNSGEYSVLASNGKCKITLDPISVNFNGQTNVDFVNQNENTISLCEGESTTLEVENGADTYTWTRDGEVLNENSNAILINQSGQYQVEVSTANCTNFSDVFTANFVSSPNVQLNLTGTVNLCQGESTVLEVENEADNYTWTRDGEVLNENSNAILINQSGQYQVEVSTANCTNFSDVFTANFVSSPNVQLSLTGTTNLCQGESTVLEVENGADTYQWFKDGIEISNETSNTLVVSTSGNYYVQASLQTCLSSSETVNIVVTPYPNVALNQSGTLDLCDDNSAILSVPDGADTYTWLLNGSPIPNESDNSLTVNESGTYAVEASNNICSVVSANVTITSNNSTAEIEVLSPLQVDLCEGNETTISVSEGANSYTWTWDGWVFPNQNGSSLTTDAAGTYFVTANFGSCTAVSETIIVSNQSTPNIQLNTSEAITLCEGETFILVDLGQAQSYQWFLEDEIIEGATSNSLEISSIGNYTLQANNGDCSVTSNPIAVSVSDLPNAEILSPAFIENCVGTELNLQAAETTGNYTWLLNGEPINDQNTSILQVNQSGNYQVTVNNDLCEASSNIVEVSFIDLPVPQLNINDDIVICAGESYEFSTNSIADSYQWFLDGFTIQNADQANFVANQSGNYTLQTTTNNCSTTSSSINLSVLSADTPTISNIDGDDFQICAGESITLLAEGTEDFAWSTGDNTPSITVSPTETSTYTLTGRNYICLSEIVEITIEVVDLDSPILEGDTQFCAGENTVLSTNYEADNYAWYYNGTLIDTNQNTQIEVSQAGNYQVIAFVGNCQASSNDLLLSVIELPTIELNTDTEITLCEGESTLVEIEGNADAYQWFLDENPIPNATTNSLEINSSGTYFATASIENCSTTSNSFVVNIQENPIAQIISPTESFIEICQGETVSLTANEGAATYQWTLNGEAITNENNSSIEVSESGIYGLIVSNNNCQSFSETIEIQYGNLLEPSIAALPFEYFCVNESVSINASVATDLDVSYTWFFNEEIIEEQSNNSIEISQEGNYQVQITSANGCTSTSAALFIEELELPNVEFNLAQSEISLCADSTLQLEVPPGADSYQWFLDGNPILQSNHQIAISESGVYSVEANNLECSALSEAIEISISAPIDTNYFEPPFLLCDDDTVTAVINTDILYDWTINGEVLENQVSNIEISEAGNYTALLYDSICLIEVNLFEVVQVASPNATIMADATTFCPNDSTSIFASENAQSYQWYQDSILLENETESTLNVYEAGEYYLEVTNDGCSAISEPITIDLYEMVSPIISIEGNSLTTSEYQSYQWFLDGNPIENGTEMNLFIEESGNYMVEVIDKNTCVLQSELVFVLYTPTQQIDHANRIMVYPNPSAAHLYIQLNKLKIDYINVYNTLGVQTLQVKKPPSELKINVSDWIAGLYFVKFQSGDKIYTKQIIVE